MMKRPVLLALALCALIGASLRLCCRVSVSSQEVSGLFSKKTVEEAIKLANECAGEICAGQNEKIDIDIKYSLRFRAPEGTVKELSDAVLGAVPGVEKCWCVYSDGKFLGTVESRERLEECMRAYIINTMPDGASSGDFSGEVRIERAYTRSRSPASEQDMVLLLSGAVPVVYTDMEGRVVAG